MWGVGGTVEEERNGGNKTTFSERKVERRQKRRRMRKREKRGKEKETRKGGGQGQHRLGQGGGRDTPLYTSPSSPTGHGCRCPPKAKLQEEKDH